MLTYGTPPEAGTTYCLRENNSSSTGCSFNALPLPSTFAATTANGSVAITLFLKDAAGKVSAASTSASVTIDTTAPDVPSGLTLKSPASSPNTSTSVTYTVSGVASGDTVAIYSAAGCTSPSFITSAVASGTSIDLSTSYSTDGSYSVHVISSDAAGNASACSSALASYTLNRVTPALSYGGATGTSITLGQTMSVSPTTLNQGGYAITACGIKSGTTALPAWASVNATTCVISGTPNAALSSTSYTLIATNAAGNSADATVSLVVTAPPLNILPAFSVIHPGLTSSVSLSSAGGTGPMSYSVTSGSGSIHSSNGVYTVASSIKRAASGIRVTDSAGDTSNASLYQIASRFNGNVRAIGIDGGFGYFGGEFTAYNPHIMNSLGKINSTTGDLESGCNLAGLLNGDAWVGAIAENSTHLFVGGAISSYAGTSVQNLIKIDKQTCKLDTTFTQSTGMNNHVLALALSGTSLYVGGVFTTYRGATAQRLAKVDIGSGNLDTTFTQSTGFNNPAYALALSTTSLYVGGDFTSYRGATAQRLAKVDPGSGNLDTTFTQSTGFNNPAYALALSGTSLYVGGDFTTYRGSPAERLAKVDPGSGNLDTTFTQSTGMGYIVYALVVSGSSLYVGGYFTTYRGSPAEKLAKVDLGSGNLDTTFTQSTGLDGDVRALALSGTSLYVGGHFTTYRGATAQGLAKVDLGSGNLDTTFTQSTGIENLVSSIVLSGTSLYVGGIFNAYRGTPAQRLAKVDLSSGNLDTTFTQSTGMDSHVQAIAISGSSIYVGGWFTTYRGASAVGLAKLDLSSGNLDTTFTQSTGTNGPVQALAPSGSSLYVGGDFTTYRGSTAQGLAKVDLGSGNLDTTFTQSTGLNGEVRALATSGTSLYVGGYFTTYRSTSAQRLAKLDLTSGNLDTTFTQSTGMSSEVTTLVISGTSLYAGGDFATYRGSAAQRLAKLDLTSGNLDTTFTQSTGVSYIVHALAVSGSSLYVGGQFTSYRGTAAQKLAKVDLTSGNLDTNFTGSSGPNASVNTLAIHGTSLYVGGGFSSYRGTGPLNSAPYFLPVDLTSGDPSDF
jgi:hypothetical protein